MDIDKIKKLVVMLHQKTLDGKVKWEKTSKVGLFLATFSGSSVRMFTKENEDSPEDLDYYLTIYNAQGDRVEVVSDILLQRADEKFGGYKLLSETYEMARRIALGVDDAIDALLSELDN